eukprot:1366270-Rhodomonas_salina.6
MAGVITCKAAVAYAPNQPLSVEEIQRLRKEGLHDAMLFQLTHSQGFQRPGPTPCPDSQFIVRMFGDFSMLSEASDRWSPPGLGRCE